MPNECSNYITITSRAESAETDIQAILQEIQSKSRQFVIITQRSKAGLRCKYITAWVPNIEFIETLLETYPSIWVKNEWISEDGTAGVFVGEKNNVQSLWWQDLSLEAEDFFFR